MANDVGHPVSLLCHEKTENSENFYVNKDACAQLLKQDDLLERELIVISINGEYRKGKSFFLNYLIRYLRNQGCKGWMKDTNKEEGFTWRGGIERCTDGIQMWSKAFPLGEKYAVILLDTEGTEDEKSTAKKMSKVFACSALISSVQIFNVPGKIIKRTMQNIQFFTEIARVSSTKTQSAPPFQKLMILVRDWIFEKDENTPFGTEGGQNHLDNWLQKDTDQDGVGQTLRSCFKKISCYLMPQPNSKVINSRGPLYYEDLGEDFRHHLQNVIELLFSPEFLETKTVGDKKLLLKDFPTIFGAFAKAVNTSGVEPKSMLMMQMENCCALAIESAEKVYATAMEAECNSKKPHADLPAAHKKNMQFALAAFNSAPIFGGNDKDMVRNYEKRIIQVFIMILDLCYKSFERLNMTKEINCSGLNEKDKTILQLKIEMVNKYVEQKRRLDEEMLKRATLEHNFDAEKREMLNDFSLKFHLIEQDTANQIQQLEFEKQITLHKLENDANLAKHERNNEIEQIEYKHEMIIHDKKKDIDMLEENYRKSIEKAGDNVLFAYNLDFSLNFALDLNVRKK